MRKRKKEIAVKGKNGFLMAIIDKIYGVKSYIFPPKPSIELINYNAETPVMSDRQIRNVAIQICKAAFAAAKYRGY